MKKYFIFFFSTVCSLLMTVWFSFGQVGMLGYGQASREGLLTSSFGVTTIDNNTYYTVSLHPELVLNKFGIGMNVDFLYHTKTGELRSKDWDESYDYFRLIRYIRYGWKGDSFYTRVGTVDASRLGHGLIMNYYTNEAEWDQRKNGLELDIDFGLFGFESITSNLGRVEIVGGRVYSRPLRDIVQTSMIKNLTFGATYVSDTDPDKNRNTHDDISIYGIDIELPLLDTPILWTGIYADYARIHRFGSGKAVGLGMQLKNLLGVAHLETRLERRWLGKEFIASYFDALYEIDRYVPISNQSGIRKSDLLPLIQEKTKGYFGEMYARVLNTIHLIGHYQRLDAQPKSGILHVSASAIRGLPGIALQASYDKKQIETFKDVRTLDNRSVARVSVGYKITPFLIFFMDYIWNFQLDETTNRYVPQERYQPRLAFTYYFSL